MSILEEFDRHVVSRRSTRPTRPIVSIRTQGKFGLNRAAYEALGRPRAVKHLWGAE